MINSLQNTKNTVGNLYLESQFDMEEYLRGEGLFTSLQEEARECVLAGITTVEEYHKIARYAE